MSVRTKIGHGLAKGLGIKLNYRNEVGSTPVTRGESTYSIDTADTYVEREPTAAEWIESITPSRRDAWGYLKSLFPFVHWLPFYNVQWLYGDLVAGELVFVPHHKLAADRSKASPLALSLFLKVWPTPSSPSSQSNLACTPPLWECSYTGSSQRRKTSPLAYVSPHDWRPGLY